MNPGLRASALEICAAREEIDRLQYRDRRDGTEKNLAKPTQNAQVIHTVEATLARIRLQLLCQQHSALSAISAVRRGGFGLWRVGDRRTTQQHPHRGNHFTYDFKLRRADAARRHEQRPIVSTAEASE